MRGRPLPVVEKPGYKIILSALLIILSEDALPAPIRENLPGAAK